jgi:hypothetical protein
MVNILRERERETNFSQWHNNFREGKAVVHKDKMQGASATKQEDKNVMKIKEFVLCNCRLTCRMIADKPDMSNGTVMKILVQDSLLRKQ